MGARRSLALARCWIVELMKKAGLEGVSLHSLRHTHASELLSNGVPIATVAKRLAARGNSRFFLAEHVT
jgi:integrase